MGRRSKIDGLPAEQFDFVMKMLVDGATDREIESAFGTRFKYDLPRTNLNRWRNKVGNELVERFKMTRFLGKNLVENLQQEGLITDENDYQIIMKSVEEHLLAAAQNFTKANPLKLLMARQEEERLQLKRAEVELKTKQHDFEREKFERTQNLQTDKFNIASETWKYILAYFTNIKSPLVDGLTQHSPELLKGLGEHIEQI